jgi:hypothetical protein
MAFVPSFDPKTGRFKTLVRLSFFKGFEKTASFENGALKYRTNGLIYKDSDEGKAQIKVINQGIRHFMESPAGWAGKDPAKFKEVLGDGPKGRWPVFDGDKYVNDDGDVREGYAGTRYLKLTNDKKIKYRDRRGNDVDEDEREELFQSGHWSIAYWHLFGIKDQKKGGNGMFATCDALQFYKRDEVFAGGGIDDDEIGDYGDDEDDLEDKPKSKKAPSIDDDDI